MSEAPNLSRKLLNIDNYKEFPTMTKEQLGLLNSLVGEIQGQVGKGISPYEGEMVAGEDPLQTQGFDALSGIANDETMSAIDRALMTGLSGMPSFSLDPAEQAKYLEQIEAPARAGFERTLRGVKEEFGGSGRAVSGGYIDSAMRSSGEFELGLGAQRAAFLRGDLDAYRQAQESAAQRQVGTAANAGSIVSAVPGALAAAGGERRSIQSELLGEGVFDWMISQPYANPWLGYLPTALGAQTKGVTSEA